VLKYFCFLFLFFASCSEYDIRKFRSPEIEVSPNSHNFGKVFVSDSSDADILIKNIGDDILDIRSIELRGSLDSFSIDAPDSAELEPGEELLFSAEYAPNIYESNTSEVVIKSNDRDERTVVVELIGAGSAPVISITPDYFDFDTVELGCEDSISINVKNVGDVDLEITDIDFLSTIPSDFNFNDFSNHVASLPIILEQDESFDIEFDYIPTDLLNDAGVISFHSNDPIRPVASANQIGMGEYGVFLEEIFVQDEIIDVDILFVVDNSGSMASNQINLIDNFSSFINIFSAAGADYRIAFITTDSPSFVGSTFVTSLSPDPIAESISLISSIGTFGNPDEKGIRQAYDATQPGGDAGVYSGFLRTDARFVLIFISDEGDFSTAVTPADLTSHALSLKSTSDLVAAHAVAGDYPYGCSANGGAFFGSGYYDVVSSLGGSFISICSADWGIDLEEVARDSVLSGKFTLSTPAIESSIEVYVDSLPSSDWYFEESTNSVVFNTPPPVGSEISIIYSTWEC